MNHTVVLNNHFLIFKCTFINEHYRMHQHQICMFGDYFNSQVHQPLIMSDYQCFNELNSKVADKKTVM